VLADSAQKRVEYASGRIADLMSLRGLSHESKNAVSDAVGFLNDRCWTSSRRVTSQARLACCGHRVGVMRSSPRIAVRCDVPATSIGAVTLAQGCLPGIGDARCNLRSALFRENSIAL
jgi:hypothetical protein